VSDQAVLAKHADRNTSSADLQGFDTAVAQLMQRASKFPAYPGWRDHQVVVGEYGGESGRLYALADSQALCVVFVAVRGARFPERMAFGLLQEFAEKVRMVQSETSLSEAMAGRLTGSLKGLMKDLMKDYSNPSKLDKVTLVHEKVDNIKGLMQDNVKKILETHVSLETLQTKSMVMSDSADKFLKQSVCLKRQVQMRNIRVKVVTAGCISAIGLYLLMPLLS